MINKSILNEEELKDIDKSIKNQVLLASEEARDMSLPEDASLFSNIFKEKGNELEIDNC